MIKLQGLDHFGIEVGDMARGVEFYSRTLGMEVQAQFGHMTLMKCGQNELALFERADLPLKGQEAIEDPLGRGHWAFNVSLEDFEAAVGRSSIGHKISLDTTEPTLYDTMAEFNRKIESHLSEVDRSRILTHRVWTEQSTRPDFL